MQADCDGEMLRRVIADLQRQAQWAEIIPFLEHNSPELLEKRRKSPATYAKNKRWLLNTERLTITQVLVFRALTGKPAMSQGEFVRLLGGNPNRENTSPEEQREILALHQYWGNQIRNNIRPLLADYFGLMVVQWEGSDKPGSGEYSICASSLLLRFFREKLYL
ncbi:MAG TPA: hypothetical protein PLE99_04555 [Candidatus Thiothrix moscowensis]|uniref:hypothetical protein n=1 Tax=unclassified Thiothrix TaxID=2636184 RepID=UPI0025D1A6F9|nr:MULTISPECIES: hypothetical protein [unclassified Thiothrix]HRJ52019.1 hypothetical protein [Candidatus Thiothrix moscowensis]HRJ92470.1 hypothetical protein [Candidatus Thiothrix moscowensis]